MKFGAQLDLYAVPEWRDKYIAYNVLKRFLTRRYGKNARRQVCRQADVSNGGAMATATMAAASLLHPLTAGASLTEGLAPEQVNQEFLSLLDEELQKVQRHFQVELSVLKDKIRSAREELDDLNTQEARDLFLRTNGTAENGFSDHSSCAIAVEPSSTCTAALPSLSVYGMGSQSANEKTGSDSSRDCFEESDDQRKHNASVLSCVVRRIYSKSYKDQDKEFQTNAQTRTAHKQRLSRAVMGIWEYADRLEGFVQLNTVALYKILKKRDKLLGLDRMAADLQEKKRTLSLLVVSQFLRDSLLHVYRGCTQNQTRQLRNTPFLPASGHSTPQDVGTIKFLVQKHLATQKPAATNWVCFFLGVCLVFLMDIAIAALATPVNPAFSTDLVLTLFPPFRLGLMACLISWGAAAAATTFELYGVNYKFLLDINPKCQVTSTTLFGIASLLTSIWIVGFALFVVDVKFGLFLPGNGYWIYPIVVCIFQLTICFMPSKTFLYEYRRNLVLLVWETLKSGFSPSGKVTLTNNILGDILTSLPKPLIDMEYTFLLYFRLVIVGHVDSALSTDSPAWMVPLISFLPYWIRLIQCFKRFCREPDLRSTHLGNMGKYLSTMVVIITSTLTWGEGVSIYASRLTFVFAYLFASLYNLIWDIVMDWGLMPDPDHFVRPDHCVLYPQWLYYAITVFNLVGRLTWALTLIPIGIINDERANASIILLVISSLEILRRSAWVMLRLENEHLTNSSRYRAILWVPKIPVVDSCVESVHMTSRKATENDGSVLSARQRSWNELDFQTAFDPSNNIRIGHRLRRLQSDPSLNNGATGPGVGGYFG